MSRVDNHCSNSNSEASYLLLPPKDHQPGSAERLLNDLGDRVLVQLAKEGAGDKAETFNDVNKQEYLKRLQNINPQIMLGNVCSSLI